MNNAIFWNVALLITDVSKERTASIIRRTKTGDLGIILAATSNRSTLRRKTVSVCPGC
jgi:hypothetical protein